MALGAAVRERRHEIGISQEELGLRSGMDRTYVGGIERGERNPTWANVVRLAEALQVTPAQLAERAQRHEPRPASDRRGG